MTVAGENEKYHYTIVSALLGIEPDTSKIAHPQTAVSEEFMKKTLRL